MNLLIVGSGLFSLLLKLSFRFDMLCWITSVMLMCWKTNLLCSFSLAALFFTVPIPFLNGVKNRNAKTFSREN